MHVIQPVILSGGSGTRLWPLSREQYPKQLLPLIGPDSLLQSTALRLDDYKGKERIAPPIVVSNEEYRYITAEQFRQIKRPVASLMLEPVGRNTAPALSLAALFARKDGADPILLVMPADQLIQNQTAFCQALEVGAELAAAGQVVTFGITPDRPETGYGYLHLGKPLPGAQVWQLDKFVEKPDQETAKAYLKEGHYLWNGGIFMLRASIWLAALARYAPEMAEKCDAAYRCGGEEGLFYHVDPDIFSSIPGNSIDYAVMEALSRDTASPVSAVVVPMDAGWSDVGAWDALWQVAEKDGDGNFVSGDSLLEDVADSLVISQGRLVACLGISNTIVIETPDVVFVAARDRAHEVRKIVDQLKTAERSEAASHRKKHRPWGYFDSVECGDRFQVKRLMVNPQSSLSLQMHHHRAEHWVVVRGTAHVTRGDDSFLLSENESTFIPLGVRHRLANPGKMPLEMIEIQSGAYLGEDDIVRFMDTYGRAPATA